MEEKTDYSDLINLTKAARYLEKSYMTLWRWRKAGKVHVVYIGGMPYVALGDLALLKEKVRNA